MTTPRSTETAEPSLTRELIYAAHCYLGGRRGLLILAGPAIVAGLALNWSWLTAAGIAPILISVLPCLTMCALGLCMNRGSGKLCSNAAKAPDPAAVDDTMVTAQAVALDTPGPPVSSDAAPLPNPEPLRSKDRVRPIRRSIKAFAVTSAVIAGLAAAPALYAHDSNESGGSTSVSGLMGQGSMMGMMGQVSEMMVGCNKMMQSMNRDGSGGTNEQWRDGEPNEDKTPSTNG